MPEAATGQSQQSALLLVVAYMNMTCATGASSTHRLCVPSSTTAPLFAFNIWILLFLDGCPRPLLNNYVTTPTCTWASEFVNDSYGVPCAPQGEPLKRTVRVENSTTRHRPVNSAYTFMPVYDVFPRLNNCLLNYTYAIEKALLLRFLDAVGYHVDQCSKQDVVEPTDGNHGRFMPKPLIAHAEYSGDDQVTLVQNGTPEAKRGAPQAKRVAKGAPKKAPKQRQAKSKPARCKKENKQQDLRQAWEPAKPAVVTDGRVSDNCLQRAQRQGLRLCDFVRTAPDTLRQDIERGLATQLLRNLRDAARQALLIGHVLQPLFSSSSQPSSSWSETNLFANTLVSTNCGIVNGLLAAAGQYTLGPVVWPRSESHIMQLAPESCTGTELDEAPVPVDDHVKHAPEAYLALQNKLHCPTQEDDLADGLGQAEPAAMTKDILKGASSVMMTEER